MINSDLFGIQLNTLNATWIPINFARPKIFRDPYRQGSEITWEISPLVLRSTSTSSHFGESALSKYR